MSTLNQKSIFQKIDKFEHNVCLYFNNFSRKKTIKRFFSIISRLGDGGIWYTLMLGLFFFGGFKGYVVALGMALMAIINVAIYKSLKSKLVRERPYISFRDLSCGTPPLDQYSFPSGHTLHAVSFTVVCIYFFPLLAVLLIPISILIAISRVVLGLHYPTDVVMGALIGAVISISTIKVIAIFL
ncbi:hypothetical protein A9Q81_23235 [Gammaproteobacteria bacterium 42_54_T18]|nr:hypothetical protein A9Q81_23235 [Gammaproteobacteria bacterium 42_54_T18]